jgi:hypothetical protein
MKVRWDDPNHASLYRDELPHNIQKMLLVPLSSIDQHSNNQQKTTCSSHHYRIRVLECISGIVTAVIVAYY